MILLSLYCKLVYTLGFHAIYGRFRTSRFVPSIYGGIPLKVYVEMQSI